MTFFHSIRLQRMYGIRFFRLYMVLHLPYSFCNKFSSIKLLCTTIISSSPPTHVLLCFCICSLIQKLNFLFWTAVLPRIYSKPISNTHSEPSFQLLCRNNVHSLFLPNGNYKGFCTARSVAHDQPSSNHSLSALLFSKNSCFWNWSIKRMHWMI